VRGPQRLNQSHGDLEEMDDDLDDFNRDFEEKKK
jgi:hypothetical protein